MIPALPLAADSVHVWFATEDDIGCAANVQRLMHVLAREEVDRASRFWFARDRCSYLMTRIMVRTVLSRYRPVPPEAWTFAVNAHGKPRISNLGESGLGLEFNLSHTRGLIALVVAASGAVGIDVESLRRDEMGRLDRVLGRQEQCAWGGLAGDARRERLWELWTFKEAYTKARGLGRSIPFSSLEFDLSSSDSVSFRAAPALHEPPGPWKFCQLRPTAEYVMALCLEGERDHDVIELWQFDPLGPACRVPVRLTRTSP